MRRMLRAVIILSIGVSGIGAAGIGSAVAGMTAIPEAADVTLGPMVEIGAVMPDGTLRTRAGEEIVLLGIRLPARLPGPWREPQSRSRDFLVDHLRNRDVRLVFDGARRDRWGRYLAHVAAGDLWIQEALVSRGWTLVDPRRGHVRLTGSLLKSEASARRAGRGLWGSGWRVLSAGPELAPADFAIVEGRVKDVATIRGRTYVNFGADWRRDFTVLFERAAARRTKTAGIDLSALTGHRIRVRGHLEEWNGPLMRLTQPAALEIVSAPKKSAGASLP